MSKTLIGINEVAVQVASSTSHVIDNISGADTTISFKRGYNLVFLWNKKESRLAGFFARISTNIKLLVVDNNPFELLLHRLQ